MFKILRSLDNTFKHIFGNMISLSTPQRLALLGPEEEKWHVVVNFIRIGDRSQTQTSNGHTLFDTED